MHHVIKCENQVAIVLEDFLFAMKSRNYSIRAMKLLINNKILYYIQDYQLTRTTEHWFYWKKSVLGI